MSIDEQEQFLLRMMVLDLMLNDIEDLASVMRQLKAWERDWVRDFTEPEVVVALRTLLENRWIDAYGFGRDRDGHEVLAKVEVAQTSEEAIRSYWFEPTQVGRDVWRDWEPPPEPAE